MSDTTEKAKERWNSQADWMNQWDVLSGEERAELIMREAAPDLFNSLAQMRDFMAYKYGEDDPFVMDADKALAKARGEA